MGALTATMGVSTNNPITQSVFVQDYDEGLMFPPPGAEGILTEGGTFILTEGATFILTE